MGDFQIPEPSSVMEWSAPPEQEGKLATEAVGGAKRNGVLKEEVFANSLDSSVILQQHYDNLDVQKSMESKQWVFPQSAVTFEDEKDGPIPFLGRGTFGEVYVGEWKHVKVAVKRLNQATVTSQKITVTGHEAEGDIDIGHMVTSIKAQKRQAYENKIQLAELEVLTKLRHPNLVLFLGICHSDSDKTIPTMIISELMTNSLHDIVEVQKLALDVPEMLEILTDVLHGLTFLHTQEPESLKHGNLTSKNVLIHGHTAKIADFGLKGQGLQYQFKPVLWTNSAGKTVCGAKMLDSDEAPQQWARVTPDNKKYPLLSEAVAFLAPEVLNGTKYQLEERMDIYSLGVILLHMCHCEFPTLEGREVQVEELQEKVPAFRNLISNLLQELPVERPSATACIEMVNNIMFNDRHYPIHRRRPNPQSQVSIGARRWMLDEQRNENKLSIKRLSQMTELLRVEGTRWQKEGALSNYLNEQLEESNRITRETTEKYIAQCDELTSTKEQLRRAQMDLKTYIQLSDKKTHQLSVEKHSLSERLLDLEIHYRQAMEDKTDLDATLKDISEHLATRDQAVVSLKSNERALEKEKRHLQDEVTSLQEDVEDMEIRLEQALSRWKAEQETTATAKADFVKLRTTCTTLLSKHERLENENKSLKDLVKEQEKSVLPEEIIAKIDDLELNVRRSTEAAEALVEQKAELESKLADMTTARDNLESELEETQVQLKEKRALLAQREQTIADMEVEVKDTAAETQQIVDDLNEREAVSSMKISKLESWVKSLEKGVLPEGETLLAKKNTVANDDETSLEEKSKANAPEEEEEDDDSLSQFSDNVNRPQRKFQLADLVLATEVTEERKAHLRKIKAEKKEKIAKAAVRAADSMAKVRVKGHERAEDGTGTGAMGMIQMMRESVHDEHISWRACRALRPMILESDKREDGSQLIRSICVEGSVDLICLDIMRIHTGAEAIHSLIQGQATQLLGVVAFGCDKVRRRAGETGAVQLIVTAMETHAAMDEKLLLHCLTTITNLCHNNQDNRHRFIEAGGLEQLTDGMETYLKSSKVQRQGCWALLTLAGTDETARLVAQGGGSRTLMTLVNALLQHPYDAGVQQFGLWAVSNLAMAGSDIARRLKKAGLPEICRISIETHPQDPEVIRQARNASGALGNANANGNGNGNGNSTATSSARGRGKGNGNGNANKK